MKFKYILHIMYFVLDTYLHKKYTNPRLSEKMRTDDHGELPTGSLPYGTCQIVRMGLNLQSITNTFSSGSYAAVLINILSLMGVPRLFVLATLITLLQFFFLLES